ncbi:MAG: phosphomannomutase/phosphoglucomutase, partial [Deltaproteobacteria bacterium]
RAIGRATARFIGGSPLVVGRDARPSSPELFDALVRGVTDEGVDIADIGLSSTPMVYFAVETLAAAGGVMITASHNPTEYNGFKVCREHAIPIGIASGLAEIEALSGTCATEAPAEPRGRVRRADILEPYVEHLLAVGSGRPALHVAIDVGNGMAGIALERLLERLPLRVERLYFEPDGRFPNHEADPLKSENLTDLIEAVKKSGAHFGVAFDGDADRAIFVDDRGEIVSSDLMTALLARPRLRRSPGGLVLFDLRSSRSTPEAIEEAGGRAEMSRVGHSFVKATMRERDAIFAGELSGHFYFRFSPTLVADDGIAAFMALLDVMAEEARPLSELIAPLRRYHASGEISRRVKDPERLLSEIEADHGDASDISHLDGLLVQYPEWWFNLRPSNTEPVVRLNVEARTREQMERERDRLLARMEHAAR